MVGNPTMTGRIGTMLFAMALLAALPVLSAASGWAVAGATGSHEKPQIGKGSLAGKRFKFYWSSRDGGGLNGIATLKADGSIEGIGSPNESTWLVDEAGRLVFKHTDGRISTRYDKVGLVKGVLTFEGPFLFRSGIVHRLVEIDDSPDEPDNAIGPDRAKRIGYSTQRFVYLDPGETTVFPLKDGTTRTIRLTSVEEHRDSVIGLVRRAEVAVEVDGKQLVLSCAPYVMPTETAGLRIQADTTSAWLEMPKRVQLSLWDATDPIVDTDRFCFPLPGYRLFSHGMQAYNEPVHLGDRDGDPAGQRFYHNYGVDLAGYEGRQKVVSCIDGVVVQANPGDGTLAIRDDGGFVLVYGHLDSILSSIKEGTPVKRGQWVGMLGKRGASGNFSHLHVGTYLCESAMLDGAMNRNLNLYPWLVAAYDRAAGPTLRAVARPHHTVRIGETVHFDGTNSADMGSNIVSYRWEFHDGTHADGPKAEKVYDKPGCYVATLWIKDDRGAVDVDFCKVKAFSDPTPEAVIPTLFVTYTPAGNIRAGQPVSFRIWPQGRPAESIEVDFGDGERVKDYQPYSAISHTFRKPGIHVVTVSATSAGLPVTQKVSVIVQE